MTAIHLTIPSDDIPEFLDRRSPESRALDAAFKAARKPIDELRVGGGDAPALASDASAAPGSNPAPADNIEAGDAQEVDSVSREITTTEMVDETARTDWAGRIASAWRRSVEQVIETGRLLIKARAAMPGAYEAMVESDLPFGPRTARMLVAIAEDHRITDRNHGSALPPSWRTLYELSRIKDDAIFMRAIEDKTIRPDMERKDVAVLLQGEGRARRLAVAEKASLAIIKPLEELGRGFSVILADPPWQHEVWGESGKEKSAENHYATMSLDAIRNLKEKIDVIAGPNCALFLWATAPRLSNALNLMAYWGFTYRSRIIWLKTASNGEPHRGTGHWFIDCAEELLLGIKGDMPAPLRGTQSMSVISAAVGRHSAKPAPFYELIESYFPDVGRAELFARGGREGWEPWGNEAP